MSSSLRQKLGKSIINQATTTARAAPSGAVVNYTQHSKYSIQYNSVLFRSGSDQQMAPQTENDF